MTPVTIELVGLYWVRLGRCANSPRAYDTAVDSTGKRAAAAREAFISTYCTGCPVVAECGRWGAETRSTGIFGGQQLEFGRTVAQRRAARRSRPTPSPLAA